MDVTQRWAGSLDLVACLIITFTAFLLMSLGIGIGFVRITVGLVTGLFVPGYVLSVGLFPSRSIDATDRLALSLGLSIVTLPLLGLLLTQEPGGITARSLGTALVIMVAVSAVAAFLRRLSTAPENQYHWAKPRSLLATLGMATATFAVVVLLVLVLPHDHYTSFYVTNTEHQFHGYPSHVAPGSTFPLELWVENHEGRAHSYRISFPSTQGPSTVTTPVIASGATWSKTVMAAAPASLGTQRLTIDLFRGRSTAVYRHLELKIDVSVAAATNASTAPPAVATGGPGS